MATNGSFRMTPQFVLGLLIVLLGVVFTLDNLEIVEARQYLHYWPALLVVFGLAKLSQPTSSGKFFGALLTLVGSLMLLDRLDLIRFRLGDWWPVILIFIGGSMLIKSWHRRQVVLGRGESSGRDTDADSTVHLLALMAGFERKNNSQNFQRGELTAIMGGVDLDLRQASIKDVEAVVDVFTFWGGVSLKVPEDWSVTVQGIPLLGGIEDKTHSPKSGSGKRLIVKGYAIMGGVEISN